MTVNLRNRRHLTVAGGSAAAVVAALAVALPATSATASPSRQDVSYHGFHLTVPIGWQVVDLATRPNACVSFTRHTVYLGTPSGEQRCPVDAVGRTEAIVVQPLTAAAMATAPGQAVLDAHQAAPTQLADNTDQQWQYAVPSAGVDVTAVYGTDPGTLRTVLESARLDGSATPTAVPRAMLADAAIRPMISAQSTNASGYGFDACSAPSSGAMYAWIHHSHYRTVGIYIGGPDRACGQPDLTSGWVSTQVARGWHLLPIYVGTQAGGLGSNAQATGKAEADAAVSDARGLGMPTGSVIYDDMEAYNSGTSRVLAFVKGWVLELHAKGYKAGMYSSTGSGVADMNAHYGAYSPDVIWFAHYNGSPTLNDSAISSNHWTRGQRVHQYTGGEYETYGNVTLNIDRDYCDVRVAGTGNTPPPVPGFPTVQNGDSGATVRALQYLLDQRDNAKLTVDGSFGNLTENAVRTFQRIHHLGVDGVAGPQTWGALIVTLKQGSSGDQVRAVQTELDALGINAAVNGSFNAATTAEVKSLQKEMDRPQSGVVDTTTWKFLLQG